MRICSKGFCTAQAVGNLLGSVPEKHCSCELSIPEQQWPSLCCLHTLLYHLSGGFIKTIVRVLRCVGHYNSKLLVDKVGFDQ